MKLTTFLEDNVSHARVDARNVIIQLHAFNVLMENT